MPDLSMQRETHLLSELDMEEPGLVMHFLKHLSVWLEESSADGRSLVSP